MELTERQRKWAEAAATEAQHGNGMTAGLFALIAQPSEREARAIREQQYRRHVASCQRCREAMSRAAMCPTGRGLS